jgi:hypothetical protein
MMPGNGKGHLSDKQAAPIADGPVKDLAVDSKPDKLTPVDALDDIAQHVDGTFVLVVKTTGGRYRRRCFLSAASAQKAARNALDAGHNATVFLAQLKPLWKLTASTPNLFDVEVG